MSWAEIMIAIKRGIVASAESVANIISGATKVGKATADGDGYEIADYYVKRAVQTINTMPTPTKECNYYVQAADSTFPYAWGQLEIRKGSDGSEYVALFKTTGDDNRMYYCAWRNSAAWWSDWRDISDGGNADTVDGRHADEFLMVNSYRYIIDSLRADTDNRNVQTQPNEYNSVFKVAGLKNNEAIGLTGTGTEYSFVIGIRGWTDSSGGDAHELAFCANGKLYHRCGSTDTWKSWSVLMDSNITVPVVVSTTAPADTTAVWIVP